MVQWIKRSFSLLGILCVLLCGVLAAKAVNHVIEAVYFGESAEPALPPLPPPRPAPIEKPTKDGTLLAERNMFCSDCQPPTEDGPLPPPRDGDEVPLTGLPVELLATNLSARQGSSFATIRNTDSGQQGSYFADDRFPGAGPIERITGTYVDFQNPASGRIERVSLLATRARKPAREDRRVASNTKPDKADPYADRINKLGDNKYEVDRTLVTQLLANPTQLGARVRPAQKDGELVGFRVFGVRRGSPLAAIGIKNGDTLQSINGYQMTTDPDKMLELYTKLKEASNLSVNIDRRGKLLAMNYQVR